MNERIKKLRKELGLTQEKFGERIGIKKNSLSQIENGINNVTEQILKSICREFHVNEDWLRHDTGEMFASSSTQEDLESSIQKLLSEKDNTTADLIKGIIITYEKLDLSDKQVINRVIDDILQNMNNGGDSSVATDEPAEEEKTTEELEAAYKKSRSGSVRSTDLSA